MTQRRRGFNRGEKVMLYLLSDGICQICGNPLPRGWHGDHIIPFSKGGETSIHNGQATCPNCNLLKGDKVSGEN